MSTKFVFVTGGVVSSLGKGIFASSLALLLKSRGIKVFMMKLDPYLNIDPGTMSPYQHGEVYVTDDGAETDLDLGHYERWTDLHLSKESSITSGKIYSTVLEKERRGDYLGACIQVIPHITNEIRQRLVDAANASQAEIVIVEIGGTVGDMESTPFLEAIRQARLELGYQNTFFAHNTLVPYLKSAGETKTKPTQHSVKELLALGIQPDAVVLRSEVVLPENQKSKISLFCNVPVKGIFEADDLDSVYELPFALHEQGLDDYVLEHFGIKAKEADLKEWRTWCDSVKNPSKKVKIALVGKYVELHDAYLSVVSALKHAGYYNDSEVEIGWIQSNDLKDKNVEETLKDYDGILVPGGFGERGSKGKMVAIRYAREHNIPFLGICFGMQLACVEFAKHVLGLSDANTSEFDPQTQNPIIDLLRDQYSGIAMGGTLRLGLYDCGVKKGTLAYDCYKEEAVKERHRHRYEFNNKYREMFEKAGMVFSGVNPQQNLVEIIELPQNDFFIASQFHPEFTSRPLHPNPLFREFIAHSIKYNEKK